MAVYAHVLLHVSAALPLISVYFCHQTLFNNSTVLIIYLGSVIIYQLGKPSQLMRWTHSKPTFALAVGAATTAKSVIATCRLLGTILGLLEFFFFRHRHGQGSEKNDVFFLGGFVSIEVKVSPWTLNKNASDSYDFF